MEILIIVVLFLLLLFFTLLIFLRRQDIRKWTGKLEAPSFFSFETTLEKNAKDQIAKELKVSKEETRYQFIAINPNGKIILGANSINGHVFFALRAALKIAFQDNVTINLLINNQSGESSISIPKGTTGIFEDTSSSNASSDDMVSVELNVDKKESKLVFGPIKASEF